MNFYEHPAFEGIDRRFLQSLDHTMSELSQTTDTTEVIATLMAISNEAKKYNISLTPDRQEALAVHLRSYLPPNKRPQFDMFIAMMTQNRQ